MYICTCVFLYICVYVYVCVFMCVYIYIYIRVYIYIYIYKYTKRDTDRVRFFRSIYIYMCIYIYIYILSSHETLLLCQVGVHCSATHQLQSLYSEVWGTTWGIAGVGILLVWGLGSGSALKYDSAPHSLDFMCLLLAKGLFLHLQ